LGGGGGEGAGSRQPPTSVRRGRSEEEGTGHWSRAGTMRYRWPCAVLSGAGWGAAVRGNLRYTARREMSEQEASNKAPSKLQVHVDGTSPASIHHSTPSDCRWRRVALRVVGSDPSTLSLRSSSPAVSVAHVWLSGFCMCSLVQEHVAERRSTCGLSSCC
jgi:hypothetical protein